MFIKILSILLPIVRNLILSRSTNQFDIIIYKVDRIGDFVLATSAIKLLLEHFKPEKCCLLVSDIVYPLAKETFPNTTIKSTPILTNLSTLKALWILFHFLKWSRLVVAHRLINLRHLANNRDFLLMSCIKAHSSSGITIDPQHWLARSIPSKPLFRYSKSIRVQNTTFSEHNLSEELCLDLRLHQTLLSLVLNKAISDKQILPHIIQKEGEQTNNGIIIITPFGSNSITSYPAVSWVKTFLQLQDITPYQIGLCGTVSQQHELNEMAKYAKAKGVKNLRILFPETLNDFTKLLSNSPLIISVDTAGAHIATALNRPTIILMGGGRYGYFGAWKRSSRQVWLSHHLSCFRCSWFCIHPEPYCITRITDKDIVTIAKRIIANGSE